MHPTLDRMWEGCVSGEFEYCDWRYVLGPMGSDYERFGATCGDRSAAEEAEYFRCLFTLGAGIDLDGWRARCGAGDALGCDLLYQFSPVGSDDELFGMTCGGVAEPSEVGCILRFGL